MNILFRWLASALAVFIVAYLLPGVTVSGFFAAFVAALIIGILNTFIKPILVVLTLPVTVLTLGLFTLVINAGLIMLASKIVEGFFVDGFWWALAFSVVLSLVNAFLHKMEKKD